MADLKGLKRICMSCGARFYDLNKKPIICPSCNTEFTGEIKVKARRGRLPADTAPDEEVEEVEVEAVAAVEDDEDEVEEDDDTVSLDTLEDDDDADDDDALVIDDEDDLIDDDLDDLDDDDIEEDIAEDEDK